MKSIHVACIKKDAFLASSINLNFIQKNKVSILIKKMLLFSLLNKNTAILNPCRIEENRLNYLKKQLFN